MFVLFTTVLLLAACGKEGKNNTITVGGKKFSEQIILVHMIQLLIEDQTDITVETEADLGPTPILHQAMINKDIDLYVEYTGTAYADVLKQEMDTTDPETIYNRAKKGYEEEYDWTLLDPFKFNNTFALAIRGEDAKELGIETYSDLAEHAPNMIFGSDGPFYERTVDGFEPMNEIYGFEWKEYVEMDSGLFYSAVKNHEVDAITAYATDGRIVRFDLQILEDDKQFFPPYFAAPLIRTEILDKYPEIVGVFEELIPHLTMEKMTELNAKVDLDNADEATVAMDFLKESGLLPE